MTGLLQENALLSMDYADAPFGVLLFHGARQTFHSVLPALKSCLMLGVFFQNISRSGTLVDLQMPKPCICTSHRSLVQFRYQVWAPDQQHQHRLRTCQQSRFPGSLPDLQNHILCGWDPAPCVLTSPSGDLKHTDTWEPLDHAACTN